MKVWILISFLFLVYSLVWLWEERYKLNYRLISETLDVIDDPISLCIPINELKQDSMFKTSLNEFADNNLTSSAFLRTAIRPLNEQMSNSIGGLANVFRLEQSYIINRHACFIFNHNRNLNVTNLFARFKYKVFVLGNGWKPFFNEFIYVNYRRNYVSLFKIYKLTIKSEQLENVYANRFECLNTCLKEKDRKSLYMYDWNDTQAIDLNASERNETAEKECDKQCKKRSSYLIYILAVSESNIVDVKGMMNISYRNIHFETYPSYSTGEFALQFIGLITLFLNLNVNETIPGLLNLVFKKFFASSTRKLREIFPKIKISLSIISLIVVYQVATHMINEFNHNSKHPIETKISDYSEAIQPFSMVVCLPVKHLILGQNFSNHLNVRTDTDVLNSYTFDALRKLTDGGLEAKIKEIYTIYGGRKMLRKYEIAKNKVYFRKCTFEFPAAQLGQAADYRETLFSRCYHLNFKFKEYNYERILPISNMVLATDYKPYFSIYLLSRNESFNSNSYHFNGDYKVIRQYTRWSTSSQRSNCTNYPTNRQSMIDSCINREYLRKHFSLTTSSVFDQDVFSSYVLMNNHFNETIDEQIVNECEDRYRRSDCNANYFVSGYNRARTYDDRFELNLYYELIRNVEQDPSKWKLTLNLLNLESIFFGTNATKALTTCFAILRLVFRFKQHKRMFEHFVFVLCLVGFLNHIYIVYKDIVTNELTQSGFYSKNDTFTFPDLVFCFELDQEPDPNYKLTGSYLNDISKRLESRFRKLSYLANGTFVDLDPFSIDESNLFRFKIFIHNDFKCLELSTDLVYYEGDFNFVNDPCALKVHLNDQFRIDDETNVYFLTKKQGSKQFNEIYKLELKCFLLMSSCRSFSVTLEVFDITYLDKFRHLKQPMSLFLEVNDVNNADRYLNKMQSFFRSNFNLSTRSVPFYMDDFDLEIDDELFEQYYLQIQNVSDAYLPKNLDNEFRTYNTYINPIDANLDAATFEFCPSFFIQRTIITNDDNYAKLIQNFLNTLSLWLNITLLDFDSYIIRSFTIFTFTHQILVSLKVKLVQALSSTLN